MTGRGAAVIVPAHCWRWEGRRPIMSPDHPGEAPARDPGPSAAPHEALGRAVRAMTVETLSARRTPEAAAEAAFARLRRDHEAVEREVSALPCRKYCAHCCYKTVSATPAEVLYLAARVESEFAAKALAKLKARPRDLDARTRACRARSWWPACARRTARARRRAVGSTPATWMRAFGPCVSAKRRSRSILPSTGSSGTPISGSPPAWPIVDCAPPGSN